MPLACRRCAMAYGDSCGDRWATRLAGGSSEGDDDDDTTSRRMRCGVFAGTQSPYTSAPCSHHAMRRGCALDRSVQRGILSG